MPNVYLTKRAALVASTAAPTAPASSTSVAGALTGFTAYFRISAVTALGESLASIEGNQVVATNSVPTLTIPSLSGNILSFNVYMSAATGTEKLQATGVAPGTYTLPTTGLLTTTATVPTADTTGIQPFTLLTVSSNGPPVEQTFVLNQVEIYSDSATVTVVTIQINGVSVFSVPVTNALPQLVTFPRPLVATKGQTLGIVLPAGSTAINVSFNGQGLTHFI